MMEQEAIRFEQKDNEVFVYGYPELKDRKGVIVGDGIAFFFGEGWRNYELYIANIVTGKIRKLSTANGNLLVDDNDIDYDAINYYKKSLKADIMDGNFDGQTKTLSALGNIFITQNNTKLALKILKGIKL